MNKLEKLENEAFERDIDIQRTNLPEKIFGIYYDDGINKPLIALNNSLDSNTKQTCVIAEELGHYYTSCGDILTDDSLDKTIIQQQENRAKRWAVKKLVPLDFIIEAYEAGSKNLHEMAEYLDITEEFLKDAFTKYTEMHGKYKKEGKYIIFFDPPGIYKSFSETE